MFYDWFLIKINKNLRIYMKFLLLFVHRHLDFRYNELDAILDIFGLLPAECYIRSSNLSSPILQIELPSIEIAKNICTRGILMKGIYQIWGEGSTYEDVKKDLISNNKLLFMKKKFSNSSWRLDVDAFGLKLNMNEKDKRRKIFQSILPFDGPIIMKNPNETFLILEDIGLLETDHKPKKIYFLRQLAGNIKNRGRNSARDLVDIHNLKKRIFIGPTSMESELALIMVNMAKIKLNDIVLDPFVGTGSILIPCAHFGALCFGMDIDIRILQGKNDKNIFSNFKQYNLNKPELIRGDNSMFPFRSSFNNFFDAIICDPPYGIRAGARKSGISLNNNTIKKPIYIDPKFQADHFPRTQPYEADDVMMDLLELANQVLKDNGRLVYWQPTTYDFTDNDLPKHYRFKVIANSEQGLTKKYARRLITMVKMTEKDAYAYHKVSSTEFNNNTASKSYNFCLEKLRKEYINSENDKESYHLNEFSTELQQIK